jgi:hypothetical protein
MNGGIINECNGKNVSDQFESINVTLPLEMLLMSRESSQQERDEVIMRKMSDEMLNTIPIQLEMEGDRIYEREWLQQRDDIMYNLNAETERIIEAFECLGHGDTGDDSDPCDLIDDTFDELY